MITLGMKYSMHTHVGGPGQLSQYNNQSAGWMTEELEFDSLLGQKIFLLSTSRLALVLPRFLSCGN
jgi:hypothetical protein